VSQANGSRSAAGHGESDLIAWIRSRPAGTPGPSFLSLDTGIGDDAAVLATEGGDALVVTTDMLVEGVHFLVDEGLERIGRKAMAASLSDVAAMGCAPRFAFVSAGISSDTSRDACRTLIDAMTAVAGEYGAVVAGGDTVDSPERLTLSVTVLGTGRANRIIRRSGARPGDRLLVTGDLGGSRLGRHLDFTPRVVEGTTLAERYDITAMIDVSDGLSTDVHHVLDESGVGARITAAHVPVSQAADRLAVESGSSALEHALHDGEDFELLFTASPETARRFAESPPFETRITDIGEILPAGAGCVLVDDTGRETPLVPGGHEHLRG
jgi:thiamine-monophosphate kinase